MRENYERATAIGLSAGPFGQFVSLAVVLIGGCFFAGGAHAAPTTYAIQGEFQYSDNPLLPVGAAYAATLTFDPATLVASVDPIGGTSYSYGTLSFTAPGVVLGGQVLIAIDSARDWIRIDQGFAGLNGTFQAGLRMNLVGAGLTSDDFPSPFPSRADLTFAQLIISVPSGLSTASVTLLEPLATVPVLTAPPQRTVSSCDLSDIGALAYSESPVAITPDQLIAEGGSVLVACGIVTLTYRDTRWGSCPSVVVTRTFAVTDACGGRASVDQTIVLGRGRLGTGTDIGVLSLSYLGEPFPPNGYGSPVIIRWNVLPGALITNYGPDTANVFVKFEILRDGGGGVGQTLTDTIRLAPGETQSVAPRDSAARGIYAPPGDYTLRVSITPVASDPNPSDNVLDRALSLPSR